MGNNDFNYRITVIVPIYNAEDYLDACFNSLLQQTIDLDEVEVLMINDGSTDQSEFICKQYSELYSNFKLFSKENEGLSATRNLGISKAQGKYICYLDADDTFSSETLKNLCDFFDNHYDEVDEITFPIVKYKNDNALQLHYRYKYLTQTGVYDLQENPFISQTNINVCIKNLHSKNVLFDTTKGFRHEDQKYNNTILMDKMKIGFVKEAEYKYNRNNDSSIVNMYMYPHYIFESTMGYQENLFSQFKGKVPQYYQALYMNDIAWKLEDNRLFPYHYEEKEFNNAVKRIKNLLEYVDDNVIVNHPGIDKFHKFYWLKMKPNNGVTYCGTQEKTALFSNGRNIYEREKVELVLYRILLGTGKIKILCCAKSPVFSFLDKPKVFAIIEKKFCQTELEMTLLPAKSNYYHTKTETNSFWLFYFEYAPAMIDKLEFKVEIDGIRYDTNYYFMPSSPFNKTLSTIQFAHKNILVCFKNNVFYISQISDIGTEEIWRQQTEKYENKYPVQSELRKAILQYEKKKEIWLYYDCKGVDYDNAYYQFLRDFDIQDGVDRYYVSGNLYNQRKQIFNDHQLNNVITFGSYIHKVLYVHADKIITAYVEEENISPFEQKDIPFFKDLFNFEIIYLQHGILHASLPWKYSPEGISVDKIVISSYFEKQNLISNYNFREKDLIPTGMPRYDFIQKKGRNTNRILFAPTWRNYLINRKQNGDLEVDIERFTNSNYYCKIMEFLNDNKLYQLLSDNDMYLDFKIHPIFASYKYCFSSSSDRINITDKKINENDYSIFITDFSSYVFDFAYQCIPVIYFVPDMMEFKEGLNSYRQLDLPFDQAFGELVLSGGEVINEIKQIICNQLKPQEKYLERMQNFFLPFDHCRDKIYKSLIGEEF